MGGWVGGWGVGGCFSSYVQAACLHNYFVRRLIDHHDDVILLSVATWKSNSFNGLSLVHSFFLFWLLYCINNIWMREVKSMHEIGWLKNLSNKRKS